MPDPGAGLVPCDAAVIQAGRVSLPLSNTPRRLPPPRAFLWCSSSPTTAWSQLSRKHQRLNRSGTKCGSACARGSEAESMVRSGGVGGGIAHMTVHPHHRPPNKYMPELQQLFCASPPTGRIVWNFMIVPNWTE